MVDEYQRSLVYLISLQYCYKMICCNEIEILLRIRDLQFRFPLLPIERFLPGMSCSQDLAILAKATYDLHPDRQENILILLSWEETNRNCHCRLASRVEHGCVRCKPNRGFNSSQRCCNLPMFRSNEGRRTSQGPSHMSLAADSSDLLTWDKDR